MNKVCITFAGAVGSSKTPIAVYLSGKLNLAVHNNDAIRVEVIEDLGTFVEAEYLKRRDSRLQNIIQQGIPFILDASIDREWPRTKEALEKNGYKWFIISLDLSKDLLTKLYQTKGYNESLTRLDQFIDDHLKFLEQHKDDISLSITDDEFTERLDLSYQKVCEWLGTNA